jgi:ribosomal protein S6--L-glutamate ligase
VAIGGRPEACRLDSELERLALASAQAVGAEMAGVDLLTDLDRDEPVVLEVNAVPGWRALAGATGVDVAAAVLSHLRGR